MSCATPVTATLLPPTESNARPWWSYPSSSWGPVIRSFPRGELCEDTRWEAQGIPLDQVVKEGRVIPNAVEHLPACVETKRPVGEQELLGGDDSKLLIGRENESAQQIVEVAGTSLVQVHGFSFFGVN